ncbi:jg5260, partial [Pararge aegeria aegeria]
TSQAPASRAIGDAIADVGRCGHVASVRAQPNGTGQYYNAPITK